MLQEAAASRRNQLTSEETALLKIDGILHETVEMQLLCHQLAFEGTFVSEIGLLEVGEDEPVRSQHTDSEKDKQKHAPPDWSEIGAAIALFAASLFTATKRIPSYFDVPITHAGCQYTRLRVVPAKQGQPLPSSNIAVVPELLHEEKFVWEAQRYTLRIYEEVTCLKQIERLMTAQYFASCVERWKASALPILKDASSKLLCLTRVNPRIVALECSTHGPDPLKGLVYNLSSRINPNYNFDNVWEYIDAVNDRTVLTGLRFLKESRLSPERMAYFFDWNRQVMKLEVINRQAPTELEDKTHLIANEIQYWKLPVEGNTNQNIVSALSSIAIASRADELNIGPNLTHRYEVGVTRDLKPFYFYSCFVGNALETHLKAPERIESQLQNILVQLCQAVYSLHQQCIVHNQLALKNIVYDTDKKSLRIGCFSQATVLQHCYPFTVAPNTREQVEYFTKLHDFEAASYAKDLKDLDDVLDEIFLAFRQLIIQKSAESIQKYVQANKTLPKEHTTDSNARRIESFMELMRDIGISPVAFPPQIAAAGLLPCHFQDAQLPVHAQASTANPNNTP